MRGAKRCGQRAWQNHVADAQAGEQRLAEGADVDHRRIGFQALHRRDRAAGKTELAVVVVLDDPAFGCACDVEQLASPRQAHDRAERVLVRWRGEDQPRRRAAARQAAMRCINGFDTHRAHHRRAHLQHLVEAPVARFLDPHGVAGVDQHAQREVDRLVHTFGDQDLIGLAAHRTRHAQMLCDGGAQGRVAAAMRIGQQLGRRVTPQPRQDAAELAMRELRDVWHAGHECAPLQRCSRCVGKKCLGASRQPHVCIAGIAFGCRAAD